MRTAVFPFLVSIALVVVSASSTLSAYAPNTPVHEKLIQASSGRFVIGLDAPTTVFCPYQSSMPNMCPAGKVTTVNEDMTQLRVAAPGGQAIYVNPNGIVSYTQRGSGSMPAGSIPTGFFEKLVLSDCAMPIRALDFESVGFRGLYACSNAPGVGTWVLEASTQDSAAKHTGCVPLEGIQLHLSQVEIGAWQY